MSREIKFRVWDKDYSKMHICGTNTHDAINFLENQACYYNQQNGCGSLPNGEGTYDLMQYTGLKDKNGVEIYEGDIVKISNHPFERSINIDGNYEVGYNDQMELCCGSWLLFRMKYYSEVIGNIYQNPELLERGE